MGRWSGQPCRRLECHRAKAAHRRRLPLELKSRPGSARTRAFVFAGRMPSMQARHTVSWRVCFGTTADRCLCKAKRRPGCALRGRPHRAARQRFGGPPPSRWSTSAMRCKNKPSSSSRFEGETGRNDWAAPEPVTGTSLRAPKPFLAVTQDQGAGVCPSAHVPRRPPAAAVSSFTSLQGTPHHPDRHRHGCSTVKQPQRWPAEGAG
jgi:hypothetical protein